MRPSLLVATMTLVAGTLALAPAQDEAPSPFVAPSDAMTESPVLNPFASPATTADNPFVTPSDQTTDPFAGAPTVTLPSTAPATGAPAPSDDPFGSASPFVNLGETAPAAPAAPAAPSNDPFATTTSTDPFAAPATAGSTADPFSTTAPAAAAGAEGSAAATPTNPDGIAEAGLTDFRYDRVMMWDGREVVARKSMTRAEAQTFDKERKDQIREDLLAGRLPGYNPQTGATATPDAWVEWAYYYEQLDMWAEYTERIALGGKSATGPLMDDMSWPGVQSADGATTAAGALGGLAAGGGLGGPLPAGGPGFGPAGGALLDPLSGGFGVAGGVPGGAAGQSLTETIVTQVIGMYERAQDELVELEEQQQSFMEDMVAGIQTRAERRDAYREWREARQQAVEDFLNNDWRRRYEGEVAMVGGVRYELYRPGTQPSAVPRNVRVVVTDTMRLTPFDLIDETTGRVLEPPSE